jgi:hypothetical protein
MKTLDHESKVVRFIEITAKLPQRGIRGAKPQCSRRLGSDIGL